MSSDKVDASDIRRTVGRMAHEVLEAHKGAEQLVVIGILSRGFPVAKRLAFAMTQIEGITVPCGSLDIRAYRDDIAPDDAPQDQGEIPFAINDRTVILVDEVIQTGRTVRAAMDGIVRHGRPAAVELAVLVDRGGRELPIEPNYVGMRLDVRSEDYVEVRLGESGGDDAIAIREGGAACTS